MDRDILRPLPGFPEWCSLSRWMACCARFPRQTAKSSGSTAPFASMNRVNGVPAKGGAMGQAGATVVGGMLFLGSGYGTGHSINGNALLAFGPE